MTRTTEWILSFLESGAIIQWETDTYLIGWDFEITHQPQSGAFFQSDFFLKNTQWWQPKSYRMITKSDLIDQLTPIDQKLPELNWSPYSKTKFYTDYDAIQTAFNASQFEKVVPTIYENSPYTDKVGHRATLLRTALLANPLNIHTCLYGQWRDHEGVIGKTPEHLFKFNQSTHTLTTEAVAGTLPSHYPVIQLVQSAKDNHEHALVVQGIQEQLQQWGTVKIDPRQTITTTDFHHLHTPMSCHLNQPFQFDAILKALHPTPALGGYPQSTSIKWLQSHPQHTKRGHFGAPFGAMDGSGNIHVVICIRNIHWTADTIAIWAGCGIVPESNMESEWMELNQKINTVKTQFNL